jgi:protein-tyrosine-phosphatase
MAEAFARHYSSEAVQAGSAGTTPADKVNPVVVDAMRERGIDISWVSPGALPKRWSTGPIES